MRRSLAARSRAGFTLVGVVVAIAIIVILLAAVGPSVAKLIERDRETELIFRGKQYGRAILAFQKRYGRLPNQLDELVKLKPRTIRQLWKDPMCNCDNWETIIAGTPEAAPMGQGPPPQGGSGLQTPGVPRVTPTANAFGFGSSGGQPTPPPFLGSGGALTPTPTSIFGSNGKKTGPIVGVRTKIRRLGIKPWRGRDYTDEWRFIAGDADNDSNGPIIDPNSIYPNRTPQPPQAPQ
ncbi:MAG TPA: prepilin-type N-terminal cleavage/methylation domain-containing protein [Thermoanaerobaculia bacterium]|nr:prepilin-type N-terminal cleavage/methylation domain-containing protein [Thermoanaerobaculia bacterium]